MGTAVGIWLFDEDTRKMAKDSSPNGNHGKLIGKPKWAKGQFGQCLGLTTKATLTAGMMRASNLTDEIYHHGSEGRPEV